MGILERLHNYNLESISQINKNIFWHYVPSINHKFPTHVINKIHRHFQHRWLEKNPGLVYSESQSGGYCKYCVLFGKTEPTVKELGVFVTRPFTNFKKPRSYWESIFMALEILKETKLIKMQYKMQICLLEVWKTLMQE